jgi:hypothetical protein
MAFSATEAAFEGFRLVKREPKSVLAWAGVQLVFSIALTLLLLPVMSVAVKVDLPPAAAASPGAVAAATAASNMAKLLPMYALMVPLYLIFFAVLSAAVYRAVLRPEDKGFARLRFGQDELRLIGAWILLGLLWIGFSILAGVVLVVLVAGVAFTARSGPAMAVLAVSITYLGLFAFFAWFAVKFSMVGPMTFAQKRIQLFGSWKFTKGRFWSLLGCYLLAFVFILIIWLVALIIDGAVAVGSTGGSFTAAATSMFRPDYSSMQTYFTPARLVLLPVGAVAGMLQLALGVAPAARAYKDIAGLSPESQADAFS